MNKTENAIEYFDKALEIDPKHIQALNDKGGALAELEKFEEAFSYFDKALAIEPDNFDTLFKKADALRAQKNYDEAFSYFYKVFNMQPDNYLTINKIKVVHSHLNYTEFDGFIETKVTDYNNNLVAHLKINEVKILNHEIAKNMMYEWNFTKIINRDGVDYEMRQFERTTNEPWRTYHGGASHYGTYLFPDVREIPLIRTDYWFYEVDKGDQRSIVITSFLPIT